MKVVEYLYHVALEDLQVMLKKYARNPSGPDDFSFVKLNSLLFFLLYEGAS
jgi:hypothetical protein